MGRAPCPGDDDLQAAINGRFAIIPQPVGRPVGADDLFLVRDTKRI
jgi:hypothetical protein